MTAQQPRLLELVQQTLTSLVGLMSRTDDNISITDSEQAEAIRSADQAKKQALEHIEQSAAAKLAEATAIHRSATQRARDLQTEKLKKLAGHERSRRAEILDESDVIREGAAERQAEEAWEADASYELQVSKFAEAQKRLERHHKEIVYRHGVICEQIRKLRETLKLSVPPTSPELPQESADVESDDLLDHADAELRNILGTRISRLSRKLRSLLMIAIPIGAGVLIGIQMEGMYIAISIASGAAIGLSLTGLSLSLRRRASRDRIDAAAQAADLALAISSNQVEEAKHAFEEEDRKSRQQRDADREDALAERDRKLDLAGPRARRRIEKLQETIDATRAAIETSTRELLENIDQQLESSSEAIATDQTQSIKRTNDAYAQAALAAEETHKNGWNRITNHWTNTHEDLLSQLDQIDALTANLAPSWPTWEGPWDTASTPRSFLGDIGVGRLHCDAGAMHADIPTHPGIVWNGPDTLDLPLALDFLGRGSLLIDCRKSPRSEGLAIVQALVARALTTVPPGQLRLTLFDPIGLGQTFAGFMHLADHEDANVLERIWTEPRHLEQKLSDITEHMERVIQTFLRNEYASLDAYNRAAGQIAEPYHLLVLNDYPEGLTDLGAKRLASILTSGPKCGVFTCLLHASTAEIPESLVDLDWSDHHICLQGSDAGWRVTMPPLGDFAFIADTPPSDDQLTSIVRIVGEGAEGSNRVEVPFGSIAPSTDQFWTRSTSEEVRVAIGQSGATRYQEFKLGRGTTQHALIAGRTGAGKSTLLHVLITNLAMWHSPEELEFHLVDFKKGVEFQTYAVHKMPHARVIAIESDREFGLSVLRRLDKELRRRGDLFRDAQVQDLTGWRAQESDPMPRVILVVDEFQEFFVDDDAVAQEAALLLDRLVRQGRAFGMHAVMGSQTLDGAFSLARSTLGQMGVRIALQCSESDSYLILSDDNPAARLLRRPGEAIYNDAAGKIEGNAPFQVVWLDEDARDTALETMSSLDSDRYPDATRSQFVFRGNVPSILSANPTITSLLNRTDWESPDDLNILIGDPIAIQDATTLQLRARSGGNTLMVGQNADAANAIMTATLLQAAANMKPATSPDDPGLMAWVFDGVPGDGLFAGRLAAFGASLNHPVTRVTERNVNEEMARLADILRSRSDGKRSGRARILLLGLEPNRLASLRPAEDDFSFSMDDDASPSPEKCLVDLLREGPTVGIHSLFWFDSLNNLNRGLSRVAQREFESRILFQMSANDSGQLIDSTTAADLGPGRGLLYSEQTGISEKFRPWAMPDQDWLNSVGQILADRR